MSPPTFTPTDSEVTEIVAPDGSQVQEVRDPDGNVVFSAGGDIPDSENLQANHDAREIALSDGTTVSTWGDVQASNDMSATGNPTLNSTGLNNNPTVSYDSNDYHRDGNILGQQQSIYAVVDQQNSSGRHTLASTYRTYSSGVEGATLEWDADNGNVALTTGDGSGQVGTSHSFNLDDGNPHIIAFCFDMDSGNQVVHADGSETTNTVSPLTVAHGAYEFGRTEVNDIRYWEGDISHVLTYNVFHSSGTRDSVVSYLQSEWGI